MSLFSDRLRLTPHYGVGSSSQRVLQGPAGSLTTTFSRPQQPAQGQPLLQAEQQPPPSLLPPDRSVALVQYEKLHSLFVVEEERKKIRLVQKPSRHEAGLGAQAGLADKAQQGQRSVPSDAANGFPSIKGYITFKSKRQRLLEESIDGARRGGSGGAPPAGAVQQQREAEADALGLGAGGHCPKPRAPDGFSRMEKCRHALDSIDAGGEWKRSFFQRKFHDAFMAACARAFFKADGEGAFQRAFQRILEINNWNNLNQEILISTPRRFGKTISVSMFAAALLYSCAQVELSIYSTCKRISQKLLRNVIKFLDIIYTHTGGEKMRVIRANCEEIHIQGPEGPHDVRITNSYPSKVSQLAFLCEGGDVCV